MKSTVRLASLFFLLASVGLLVTLSGCSAGTPGTGAVTGKVTTADGQTVTSGSLTFAPATGTEGKPATGVVQADGSYTLTTYEKDDGAVIGRHNVTYSPGSGGPDEEEEGEEPSEDSGEHDEEEVAPEVPFSGLMPKESEVEVKAGPNEINIELVADPNAGGEQEGGEVEGGE